MIDYPLSSLLIIWVLLVAFYAVGYAYGRKRILDRLRLARRERRIAEAVEEIIAQAGGEREPVQ